MESAQYCGQCGARIPATEKFCTACGSPRRLVEGAATAPSVPATGDESRSATNNASLAPPKAVNLPGISSESPLSPKGLLSSGVAYVLVYLVLAVPTYVLPYFGSNSAVLNIAGQAMGLGALPQFWFHLVALYLLVVVAWIRGGHIGKQWLAIFPVLAGIFDMVPGFSVIPLIPTIFHVLALVMGVSGKVVPVDDSAAGKRRVVLSAVGFAAIAILAFVKTQAFFLNAKQGPSWEKPNAQQGPYPGNGPPSESTLTAGSVDRSVMVKAGPDFWKPQEICGLAPGPWQYSVTQSPMEVQTPGWKSALIVTNGAAEN